MMPKEMFNVLASPSRLVRYKAFAAAFSYPEDKEQRLLYDRLFRQQELWLYIVEYLCENEFQRVEYLADIQGFYRAFGLKPEKERPDFLVNVLEFMHYLIFKQDYARNHRLDKAEEKIGVCLEAEKKFFHTYLYPAAKVMVQKILAQNEEHFYTQAAREFLEFLEKEKAYLKQ